MRRWLRARLLLVLIALALIPAATLPFAGRLRDEWTRFWEPKAKVQEPNPVIEFESVPSGIFIGSTDLQALAEVERYLANLPDAPPSAGSGPNDAVDASASKAAADDAQRRAFFDALRGATSSRRASLPGGGKFETFDEAEMIDVNELIEPDLPPLQIPLKPREGT